LIAANNSYVLAYDNLSHVREWLSDALRRISTGGGSSTRALYTDTDEVLIDVQRPIIMNGIAELATRPDLVSRSMLTRCGPLVDKEYDEKLWTRFRRAHPLILGALLDAAVEAMRNVDATDLADKPRMSDAARWITAAEPARGWPSGSFLASYNENIRDAKVAALEASPVAVAFQRFAVELDEPWQGAATELLEVLGSSGYDVRRMPHSARGLSDILRRFAPNFRSLGIETEFDVKTPGSHSRRLIVISPAKLRRKRR
jgi:hypothetical protein